MLPNRRRTQTAHKMMSKIKIRRVKCAYTHCILLCATVHVYFNNENN